MPALGLALALTRQQVGGVVEGGWSPLRTDLWNVSAEDAPAGYDQVQSVDDPNCGVQDGYLYVNRSWPGPIVLSQFEFGDIGGKLRIKLTGGVVSYPPFPFGRHPIYGFSTGVEGAEPGFTFLLHFQDAPTGPLFLTVKRTNSYVSLAFPGVTDCANCFIELFQVALSATQVLIVATLFDTDGTTVLGKVAQIAWSDWANNGALPTPGAKFGISGNFTIFGRADFYDYVTGNDPLAAGDAYIISIAQAGCVVAATPGHGGSGTSTYQWKKRLTGIGLYVAIAGATDLGDSFALSANTSYEVICTVSDGLTTADSVPIVVDTTDALTIISHGESITVGNANGTYYGFKDALEQELIDRGYRPYFYNFGMGATETEAQAMEPFVTNAAAFITRTFADLITFRAATNDAGASRSIATVEGRIQAGPQVAALLLGVPMLYLCEPWTGIGARETVLETYDVIFSDEATAHPGDIFWQGDGPRTATANQTSFYSEGAGSELHPNATGWAVLAPLDADAIETALGL